MHTLWGKTVLKDGLLHMSKPCKLTELIEIENKAPATVTLTLSSPLLFNPILGQYGITIHGKNAIQLLFIVEGEQNQQNIGKVLC